MRADSGDLGEGTVCGQEADLNPDMFATKNSSTKHAAGPDDQGSWYSLI